MKNLYLICFFAITSISYADCGFNSWSSCGPMSGSCGPMSGSCGPMSGSCGPQGCPASNFDLFEKIIDEDSRFQSAPIATPVIPKKITPKSKIVPKIKIEMPSFDQESF